MPTVDLATYPSDITEYSCSATVGRAVLAIPRVLPGSVRPVSAGIVNARLRRSRSLSTSLPVSASVLVADVLVGIALDSREVGYTISGITSPAGGNAVVYWTGLPAYPKHFTSNGELDHPRTGYWTLLEGYDPDNWTISVIDNNDNIVASWAGNGATPDAVVTWTLAEGAGSPVVTKTMVRSAKAIVTTATDLLISRKVAASVAVVCTASAALKVGSFLLSARAVVSATASGSLDRKPRLRATSPVSVAARASIGTQAVIRSLNTPVAVTVRASLDAGRDGLGVADVIQEILLVWGVEKLCAATTWMRNAALTVLNSALQTLWNQARDRSYWTRSTLTVTFQSGESESPLARTVQNVIGPVRDSGTRAPLMPIGTRAELEQFEDLYLEGSAGGSPVGYYIDRRNQAGKEPCAVTLHLSPAPSDVFECLVDAVLEAPRFGKQDIDASPRIPIPHLYIESLLIPVVRHLALSSHLTISPERAALIKEEYARASVGLENADPLPGKHGDNTNRREEATV